MISVRISDFSTKTERKVTDSEWNPSGNGQISKQECDIRTGVRS